ncbi:IclR family transcriptional regulator, partial [bacterium]|nr:IclR family transcriptional regulator [bacterium]
MSIKNGSDGRIIQSVERAIKALLLFLEGDEELAIKDFAKLLDLPKPTIHSIVNTLTVYKLLEQNPDNSKYHLGPVIFRLGLQYVRNMDFLSAVRVWIERLSYKYRKPVNVCMLIAGKMIVVYKFDPDDPLISYPNVGATVPIHNTCNGKVLMANITEQEKNKILKEYVFVKSTKYTISNRADYEKELEIVKNEGIAYNRQEGVMGISAISGPIYNHNGQVIASFSISGVAEEFE